MAARRPALSSVAEAVARDLRGLKGRDPELAGSGLAALALSMARQLDDFETSATARSMCARVLLDTLTQLRDLAPQVEESDDLDDLAARRAARLAGGAGTAG